MRPASRVVVLVAAALLVAGCASVDPGRADVVAGAPEPSAPAVVPPSDGTTTSTDVPGPAATTTATTAVAGRPTTSDPGYDDPGDAAAPDRHAPTPTEPSTTEPATTTPTTAAPTGPRPAPTGFTLTVGERFDPCTHPYAGGWTSACYDVRASWDDPGDPDALWNLVPGEDEIHPDLVTVPIGPAPYPRADGRVSVSIAVREATTVCIRLAEYAGATLVNRSDLARACVTTPGVPSTTSTTSTTTSPTTTSTTTSAPGTTTTTTT